MKIQVQKNSTTILLFFILIFYSPVVDIRINSSNQEQPVIFRNIEWGKAQESLVKELQNIDSNFYESVESQGPNISLISPSENTSHQSGTLVDLNIEDINGISEVIASWNGLGVDVLTAPYDLALPTSEGMNTLSVFAKNGLQEWSTKSFVFIVDNTIPNIVVLSPESLPFVKTGDVIRFNVADEYEIRNVTYRIDEGITRLLEYPFEYIVEGSDSIHTLHIEAYDLASNVARKSIDFVIDDTPPEIELLSPDLSLTLNQSSILSFNITDNQLETVVYSWNSGNTIRLHSPYKVQVIPEGGTQLLTIIAIDKAGNNATKEYTVFVQNPYEMDLGLKMTYFGFATAGYVSLLLLCLKSNIFGTKEETK